MVTKITLTDYPSRFFPILAAWKSPGGHAESAVFEKLDQVENYFSGLFWAPVIIDRREQGRRSE